MPIKCLTSFGYGRQQENFEKSTKLFSRYADKHGYDYHVPKLASFNEWRISNPDKNYAWLKLPLLSELLASYDVVLWIDADVVIVDDTIDILDEADSAPMAMVVHRVRKGCHPNTGVWLLRRDAKNIIDEIDIRTKIPYRVSRWYEQAALHRHFGMDLNSPVLNVPQTSDWSELPYRYNSILQDGRGLPEDASFIHAAGYQHVFDNALART